MKDEVIRTTKGERLMKGFEKEMLRSGAKMSRPLKCRAIEIMKSLAPQFVITGFQMGMGGWFFEVRPFKIQCDDNSVMNGTGADFADAVENPDAKTWSPVGLTAKHRKLFKELHAILTFLTDEKWTEIFDWKP